MVVIQHQVTRVKFVEDLGDNSATLDHARGLLRIEQGCASGAVAWVREDVAPLLSTGRTLHSLRRHLRAVTA